MAKSCTKVINITLCACFGSVLLSFIALLYSQVFTDFFEDNPCVQYSLLFIFFTIGVLILIRSWINIDFENPLSQDSRIGNFWKGLLLAFINPPALLFWILIISICNTYLFSVSKFSPVLHLACFFVGIFFGKVTTLYFYGKMSKKLGKKKNKKRPIVITVIGVALVIGSLVQFTRMLLD